MPSRYDPARRLMLLLSVPLALSSCDLLLRPELVVAPTLLEFPSSVSLRTIEVSNTGAEGSLLRWGVSGSNRLSAWPTGGSLRKGETQVVTLSVNRAGLVQSAVLTATVSSGDQDVEITAFVDPASTPVPAPCDVEPDLRYAGIEPWPLEAAAAAFAAAGVVPTGVIVRWRADGARGTLDTRDLAAQLLQRQGAAVTGLQALDGAAWITAHDPVALADRLSTDPSVRWVELDGPIVRPTGLGATAIDDPAYLSGDQWWLDAFGFAEGRLPPGAVQASDVTVAVIDTGLRLSHEEHAGRFVAGRSFVGGVSTSDVTDADGHGTHVAGLIAAAEGNGLGIVGIASHAGVRVQPIRVFDDLGRGTIADLVLALRWAAGLGSGAPAGGSAATSARADVINMSLGTQFPSAELRKAVIDARCEDVLLVAAAGNGYANVGLNGGVDFPAAYPEVISVGSVDQTMLRSAFSDFGETLVDIMAPGGRPVPRTATCSSGLWSTYHLADDAYTCLAGTSMATPLVAGSAAVLIATDPGRYRGDPAAVESALRSAAARRPGPNSAEYGFGVLCLDALLTDSSVCGVPTAP